MEKLYKFDLKDIENSLKFCVQKGVTEVTIADEKFAGDKNRILKFLDSALLIAPDIFYSIKVSAVCVDFEVCKKSALLNVSFEIPLVVQIKNGKALFDKKFYAKKCHILNEAGIVFGFSIFYADFEQDTFKYFKERLDFAIAQYPNHIDFPQIEDLNNRSSVVSSEVEKSFFPKVTGIFSANEIRFSRNIAFACRTFYSAGRAVTWFNSVLRPLKVTPSSFFMDFAEWQHVNNCDYKSGFVPEDVSHNEIEKMQLLFLEMKYEEKKCISLIEVIRDIVKINGALTRFVSDSIEQVVQVHYNPDDLFSAESQNIEYFCANVCMENCSVKFFENNGEIDYKIL